jgi:hypothetical protein
MYVQGASRTCEAAQKLAGASDHMQEVYALKIQHTSFIPEAVFGLQTLRELTLFGVSELSALTGRVKYLKNLRVLRLENWRLLLKLPSAIFDLKYLQELSLHQTGIRDLLSCIPTLTSWNAIKRVTCCSKGFITDQRISTSCR